MAMVLGSRAKIHVGRPVIVDSVAPPTGYGAVFEDDGETGYLYAVRIEDGEPHILDAVHIYGVGAVTDHDRDHEVELIWQDTGLHVALRINGYVHAMFGFDPPLAMCIDDFPPANGGFTDSHAWDEPAFKRVFPELTSEWSWQNET